MGMGIGNRTPLRNFSKNVDPQAVLAKMGAIFTCKVELAPTTMLT
jgi:hypothetical protein